MKHKILHLIKSLGRGGAEMLLPETLRLHHQDRFEFHYVYFLPWKDQMVESLKMHGGKVSCYAANNNIELITKARAIAKYITDNKIELVHAHLPWAGIVARIVKKMTGVPVIYTEHNKQERYHWITRKMNLATMNWLDRVIAVSADVEDSIRKHKTKLKIPVQTVLNGVNTEHFSPETFDGQEVRRLLGIPAGAPVIGTIAVFRFQKRLDLWLEIAKKISEKVPDVHFIIVGDGPQKGLLLEKCSQLELDDRVHFTGVQTEVRPYLAAFDLYMMSSIFEGLPIALLEAMASGCAVVSTDAGGIKEVIRHDAEGLLCGVDEAEKLVGYASDLLQDHSKRKALALQGRRRIEESFSMEMMVEALEKVYETSIKP